MLSVISINQCSTVYRLFSSNCLFKGKISRPRPRGWHNDKANHVVVAEGPGSMGKDQIGPAVTAPTHWFETHVRWMRKGPLQSYFSERGNRVIKWNRRGIGYPHSSRHCSERDVLVVVGLHSTRRATVAPSTEWVLVLWVLLALL